jgi:CPA1 family monovalent cation:H+ antiporter
MRGGVSLAAALALPLIAAGHAFPDRSNVIVIAYIVIAATLVIFGLTLSPLIRRLGLTEEEALARQEARARVALAHAALGHVEELAEREELPEPIAEAARLTYEQRIHRLEPRVDGDAAAIDEAATARRIRELRRELIAVERRRLADLRRRGEISAESMRRIEHELDLEESRLAQ